MRIAFVTSGRFWFVDLARELERLGHDTRVYSLVPPQHTARFELPSHSNRWLGWYAAPAYALSRTLQSGRTGRAASQLLLTTIDHAAALRLEPCDVIVGMSGIALHVLEVARRRYGATVFLERASRHILSQREILRGIPGAPSVPVPDHAVKRELAGYALADVVTVPSMQVAESFLERGFPRERLFLNNFGVNVDIFQNTPVPAQPRTIITVGAWSLRKGCDVLTAACRSLQGTQGVRLLHVGPILDAPVPSEPWFEHVDPVPQNELPRFYAQAHVFALASREEGLALVQVQALACGLPIVCTSRTGGADLKQYCAAPEQIDVVPADNVDALTRALSRALDGTPSAGTPRSLLHDREQIGWAAYAQRYEQEMLRRRALRG